MDPQPSQAHQQVNKAFRYVLSALQFLVLVPVYAISKVLEGVIRAFPFFSRVIHKSAFLYKRVSPGGGYHWHKLQTPQERASAFILDFDRQIGNRAVRTPSSSDVEEFEHEEPLAIARPAFMPISASQALFQAKRDIKWLFIYLQSDMHQDCNSFSEKVLINPHFLQFISERDISIWGGSVSNSEAYQLSNFYKVYKFPFLGLFGFSSQETSARLELVYALQGLPEPLSVSSIIFQMREAYDKNEPHMALLRERLHSEIAERSMRLDQDAAYQRSLQADRERENQRQLQRQREADAEAHRCNLVKWAVSRVTQLDETSPDRVKIAVRLIGGRRVTQEFSKQSRVADVYAWCYLTNAGIEPQANGTPPVDFVPVFPFKLVNVYPRHELLFSDAVVCECELLQKNGNLVMEKAE